MPQFDHHISYLLLMSLYPLSCHVTLRWKRKLGCHISFTSFRWISTLYSVMIVILINVFLVIHIFCLSFSTVPLRSLFQFSSFLCHFVTSFIDKFWSISPLHDIFSPLSRCKLNSWWSLFYLIPCLNLFTICVLALIDRHSEMLYRCYIVLWLLLLLWWLYLVNRINLLCTYVLAVSHVWLFIWESY